MQTLEKDLENVDEATYLLANVGEFINLELKKDEMKTSLCFLRLILRRANRMRDELRGCECENEVRGYVEFLEKIRDEDFENTCDRKFFSREALEDLFNRTSDFIDIYQLNGRKTLS